MAFDERRQICRNCERWEFSKMSHYHDNSAIVMSRLQCEELSCNQTRHSLLFSIRNDCNKSSIFYNPLFATKIELFPEIARPKINVISSGALQSKVHPNTVEVFILFMRSRFTQGQHLDPDCLMAAPPFITEKPALWSMLGSHLAQRIETALKYSIMH